MNRRIGVGAAFSAVVAVSLPLAHAQPGSKSGGLVFSVENDVFARGRTTDRWYTNGLHFAKVGFPLVKEEVEGAARAALFAKEEDQPTVSFLLGQNMYTPRTINDPEPQPTDRPWGGFLYVGAGASNYAGKGGAWNLAGDLKVGAIGPASLAKQVQRAWHDLINAIEPLGWDNQLRPRLGVQASYMVTYRWYDFSALPALGVQPYGRLTAGNTKVAAVLGVTTIVGEKRRVIGATDEGDFLATDISQRKNYFEPGPFNRWSFYAQAQLASVWHNYFVTGTTFRDQANLTIKRYVWTTAFGAIWKGDCFSIQYTLKRRTPEFELADSSRKEQYQRYGEVRLVVDTN